MGTRYLIDTNTVVKYIQGLYDLETRELIYQKTAQGQAVYLSFMTKIELLAYNPQTTSPAIITYQENVAKFIANATILMLDDEIVLETIRIRKTTRVKIPDCIIAATAIKQDMILLSSNDSDFSKIVSLGLQYEYIKSS
jgi:predicted nucleic acid-binding protein